MLRAFTIPILMVHGLPTTVELFQEHTRKMDQQEPQKVRSVEVNIMETLQDSVKGLPYGAASNLKDGIAKRISNPEDVVNQIANQLANQPAKQEGNVYASKQVSK